MNLPELSLVPTPGSADVLVLGLAEAASAPVVVGASEALEA